jgi:hypothetical protein
MFAPEIPWSSRRQPVAPCVLVQADGDFAAKSDKRLLQHARLLGELLEPPVIGMHRALQAKVEKAARLAVHQAGDPKTLREPPKFSQRGSPLLEIDEVREDPALGEEPERLTGIGILLRSENLHLASLLRCASHTCPLGRSSLRLLPIRRVNVAL